jgi:hypothetical protein
VVGTGDRLNRLNYEAAGTEVELSLDLLHCHVLKVEMADLCVKLLDVVFTFLQVQKVESSYVTR